MDSLEKVLDNAVSFDELFRAVKRVVEKRLGLRRAGLGLVLADLPPQIAGFTALGSNSIVLNRALLNAMKGAVSSRRELNSYVFIVLLHEYLHTLGLDEEETRRRVVEIVSEELGEEHVAFKMAVRSPYELYPSILAGLRVVAEKEPEIVKEFDSENTSYIG